MDISKEISSLYDEYKQRALDIPFETDVLTGCLQREMLFKAIDAQEFDSVPIGLIYFEAIGMGHVTDMHGPLVGDELLCRMTSNIHDVLRDSMRIYRIHYNGFLIVFPRCTDFELAQFIDDWLSLQVKRNKEQDKFICVSAVGSAWSSGNTDFFELFNAAHAVFGEDKRRKDMIYSPAAVLKADERAKGL